MSSQDAICVVLCLGFMSQSTESSECLFNADFGQSDGVVVEHIRS